MNKILSVFIKICVLVVLAFGQSISTCCDTMKLSHLHDHAHESATLSIADKTQSSSPVTHHNPFSTESNSELEVEEEPEKINDERDFKHILRGLVLIREFTAYPSFAFIKVSNEPQGIWKPPQNLF
jgi:hypothetical protein